MMIDRREFVSGTALVAVAPTLSLLPVALPTPAAKTNRLGDLHRARNQNADPIISGSAKERVVMKIVGWSTPGQRGTDEEVWITVDRSWRTAWR